MQLFHQKIFDDYVVGTSEAFTSESLNELLGAADRLVLHALVDSVSGTSPGLTIAVEQAGDGHDFSLRSSPFGLKSIPLSTTSLNSLVGWEEGIIPSAGNVRATLTLSGTTPVAHVELWATGRIGKRPFAPPDLQGLAVWLSADAGVSLSSGAVSSWADISGAGIMTDVHQTTAGNRPTFVSAYAPFNNRPAVYFPLSTVAYLVSDAFSTTLSAPGTVFAVWQTPNTVSYSFVFDGINGTDRWAILEYSGTPTVEGYGGVILDVPASVASPSVTCLVVDTSAGKVRVNGNTAVGSGSTGSSNLTGITLGARFNFANSLDGYIGEFIVYNRVLTTNEIQLVESYLAAKYGVKIT